VCDTVSEIPTGECAALVVLYESTQGAGWVNSDGWLADDTPCDWYGVACDAGRVVSLQLADNNLSGSLPAELGGLTALTELFLGGNDLSGALPWQLAGLSELEMLHLSGNKLQGEIPAELGQLASLERLYLNGNQLSGRIPEELSALGKLEFLYLNGGQLDGAVPAELCDLNQLTVTDLGYNMLLERHSDPCVDALDSDWPHTQTVPPEEVRAAPGGAGSVAISWDPIQYIGDPGYYEVFLATAPGGPYQLAGRTADKAAGSHEIRNLQVGVPYYFVVRTITLAGPRNQNNLISADSAEVTMQPVALGLASLSAHAGGPVGLLLFVVAVALLTVAGLKWRMRDQARGRSSSGES
jgi:hypothetical protein